MGWLSPFFFPSALRESGLRPGFVGCSVGLAEVLQQASEQAEAGWKGDRRG
jgi:hypothetical protein